jgi:acetyltransferase-like isoleucine patch superfamily enzyme
MANILMVLCRRFILNPYYRTILGQLGGKSIVPYSTKFEKPKNIFIGKNVSIGRMSWLAANPLTGGQKCSLKIGDGTYIGNFSHIYCTSEIEIGEHAIFADRVYVTDNLHTYTDPTIPIISQPIIQLQKVTIGNGSWIGENACIIGANVGKQSVVGSNAVVTKDIPDYCVAVGSPAKIIKRFSFEKQLWLKTDAEGNFLD